MRAFVARPTPLLGLGWLLLAAACSGSTQPPPGPTGAAPAAETVSPADSPVPYKVLEDTTDRQSNSVQLHVLVTAPGELKHDAMDNLLKYLYRHMMTRREDAPAAVSAFVYTSDAQFRTPPRSPLGTAIKRPEDMGPTFDNKVPLEFWQQVEQALPHGDKGWKLEKKVVRDDKQKTLVITYPYTEPGKDEWPTQLSFNRAMNEFTDITQALFEKVPELRAMTFSGVWLPPKAKSPEPQEVVHVELTRADYQGLKLNDIEEQIGQLHGRAFLEIGLAHQSDASVTKANAARLSGVYRKMLGQLKSPKPLISPLLK